MTISGGINYYVNISHFSITRNVSSIDVVEHITWQPNSLVAGFVVKSTNVAEQQTNVTDVAWSVHRKTLRGNKLELEATEPLLFVS